MAEGRYKSIGDENTIDFKIRTFSLKQLFLFIDFTNNY